MLLLALELSRDKAVYMYVSLFYLGLTGHVPSGPPPSVHAQSSNLLLSSSCPLGRTERQDTPFYQRFVSIVSRSATSNPARCTSSHRGYLPLWQAPLPPRASLLERRLTVLLGSPRITTSLSPSSAWISLGTSCLPFLDRFSSIPCGSFLLAILSPSRPF